MQKKPTWFGDRRPEQEVERSQKSLWHADSVLGGGRWGRFLGGGWPIWPGPISVSPTCSFLMIDSCPLHSHTVLNSSGLPPRLATLFQTTAIHVFLLWNILRQQVYFLWMYCSVFMFFKSTLCIILLLLNSLLGWKDSHSGSDPLKTSKHLLGGG